MKNSTYQQISNFIKATHVHFPKNRNVHQRLKPRVCCVFFTWKGRGQWKWLTQVSIGLMCYRELWRKLKSCELRKKTTRKFKKRKIYLKKNGMFGCTFRKLLENSRTLFFVNFCATLCHARALSHPQSVNLWCLSSRVSSVTKKKWNVLMSCFFILPYIYEIVLKISQKKLKH